MKIRHLIEVPAFPTNTLIFTQKSQNPTLNYAVLKVGQTSDKLFVTSITSFFELASLLKFSYICNRINRRP
jgi:hypothetical protein